HAANTNLHSFPTRRSSDLDRRRYRDKVRRSLEVFARMLHEHMFDTSPSQVGLEIELNLVDSQGEPSMHNADVLDAIADPAWATRSEEHTSELQSRSDLVCR